jgi:hypothetical protein
VYSTGEEKKVKYFLEIFLSKNGSREGEEEQLAPQKVLT